MNALMLACALAAAPAGSPSVYTLKDQSFTEQAKHDLSTLKQFVEGLERLQALVKKNESLFATKERRTYSPDEKRTLLTTWGAFFSYFSSLESMRQRYWDFVTLSPTDSRHPWGFLVTHAALTSMLAHGTRFAAMTLGNQQLETLFDEPNAEFGVPAGSFAQFKEKALHVATSTQLFSGDTWAPSAQLLLKRAKAFASPEVAWAFERMQTNGKEAEKRLTRQGPKLFAANALDIFKDSTAETIFPAQKNFAEWAGDTRVARVGKPLITREQLDALIPRLQPGDVVVVRQNWFLSNIALPGFWPHAELYAGSAADLKAAFDADPEVAAWAQKQKEQAKTFTELLEKRFPAKWKAYQAMDFQGHAPIRVIEAISEGVSFTAPEHAFGVDYLGVMRPRLSALEKARAIERAFAYQGRPYDFDFDFFSDAALVCTELVYKSYAPSAEQKGLSIGLVDVAGRRTLPANDLVRQYAREAGTPSQQLDFVAFLDGHEKDGVAVEADEKAFRASCERVKWDVAQK
ncbi:MAG: protein tyrosine phosphatase [Myxococcaceae bacterium]|nr:protein tyrosine phosphatase [Myxococcaceae bacterium]